MDRCLIVGIVVHTFNDVDLAIDRPIWAWRKKKTKNVGLYKAGGSRESSYRLSRMHYSENLFSILHNWCIEALTARHRSQLAYVRLA